jgi:hypothetical protein
LQWTISKREEVPVYQTAGSQIYAHRVLLFMVTVPVSP